MPLAGGGQDLGPLHAVGVRPRLGTGRQPDGHEGAGDGADVDQHVAGVGQEDERVGGDGGATSNTMKATSRTSASGQGAPVGPPPTAARGRGGRGRAQPCAVTWSAWDSTSSTSRRTWASSTT